MLQNSMNSCLRLWVSYFFDDKLTSYFFWLGDQLSSQKIVDHAGWIDFLCKNKDTILSVLFFFLCLSEADLTFDDLGKVILFILNIKFGMNDTT